jgi:uncharacterized MAPEG superfamily protein
MDQTARQRRVTKIVVAYPFGILVVALVLNLTALGVEPLSLALPSYQCAWALVISAVLLVINHTWLMTSTELTRVRFGMLTTPEEWQASGRRREDIAQEGVLELERRHNAHRNTTENTVYFVMLALLFSIVSPPNLAAYVWIMSFPLARLGYTFSYLHGKDGMRSLFMTLGLLSMYGMASYLVVGLIGSAT